QVHRGVLHEGGEVAVKIQYPGVGGTISGDLQLVRQIVAPFFKSPFVTRFLGEIEERLREETDYHREFANTEWFRENLGMPGILIPKAHPKYSTGAVLTTDLLTGLSFDRFLETNPSQEMKNRFGQTLYDLFMNCLFRLNRMHADPNPGNYLFREDGRVGLIDFGCVKVLEPEFCKTMSELWRAHLRRDIEAERRIYKVFGVNQSEDEWERVYEKMLKPFGEWLSLPMQNEVFDFGKHPDYCDRAGKFMGYVINDPAFSKFTTNTIFVDRTIYGLFRIFGQLGAQIRFHNEWVY
ncbi:MAG: AarF/ABC1/UbiB kinase family protein, partial [Bdellovibrionia bacterium]